MLTPIIILALAAPAPTANAKEPHGNFTFTIVDSEGNNIPARLTFMSEEGEAKDLFPNPDADPKKLAVRKDRNRQLLSHWQVGLAC